MSIRHNVTVLAILTLGLPAAFAQTTAQFTGGEAGWSERPAQTSVTRAQVRSEFLRFRSNPVAPDGSRYVGGEQGYTLPVPIAHNPPPPAIKSAAEQKQFEQQYPA